MRETLSSRSFLIFMMSDRANVSERHIWISRIKAVSGNREWSRQFWTHLAVVMR